MVDDTKLHSEGVFDYARDNIEVPAASFDKIAVLYLAYNYAYRD